MCRSFFLGKRTYYEKASKNQRLIVQNFFEIVETLDQFFKYKSNWTSFQLSLNLNVKTVNAHFLVFQRSSNNNFCRIKQHTWETGIFSFNIWSSSCPWFSGHMSCERWYSVFVLRQGPSRVVETTRHQNYGKLLSWQDLLSVRKGIKKMLVYITRKINMAFSEGLWKNVEDNIFTFTSECSRRILALPLHHIIIEKSSFSMY